MEKEDSVGDSDRGLGQVIRAVEDAESAIKQQKEENNQLWEELLRKTQELEIYKADNDKYLRKFDGNSSDKPILEPHDEGTSMSTSTRNDRGMIKWTKNSPLEGSQAHSGSNLPSTTSKVSSNAKSDALSPGTSHLLPSSSKSLSPSRNPNVSLNDSEVDLSGQELLQTSETDYSQWKQELNCKVKEQEGEILQLKRHLTDYSVKETQLNNEKYVLEKRIADMRLAFDEQQKELVDAASKALSYRQDIIEENIHLTFELQAAHQDRSTYISSLLPILADHGLQPTVANAFSIINNLKVLLRHLHEKIIIAKEKLKGSQYPVSPWHYETSNATNVVLQPPSSSSRGTVDRSVLQIVSQPSKGHAHLSIASTSDAQRRAEGEVLYHEILQASSSGTATKDLDKSHIERSPLTKTISSTEPQHK